MFDSTIGNPSVRSFARQCSSKTWDNKCSRDSHFDTCFTSCQGDYCNNGNGIPTAPPPSGKGSKVTAINWMLFSFLIIRLMLKF